MAALRPVSPPHDTHAQGAGVSQAPAPVRGWRHWFARWVPRTLFGRLALLLFVAVLASHVLALTLMFNLHDVLGRGPPPSRQVFQGAAEPAPAQAGEQRPRGEPRPNGPPGGPPSIWDAGLLLDIGVRLSALMVAAWVGARWLSKPIDRLALAARELGKNIDRPPLSEDGPTECKEAIQVFNQMQAQIRRQLEERDRFVAAVSHDLRTPLTRLRLRAETLESSEDRRQFGRDIVEMDEMITATLDHLRGVADPEPLVQLDVKALVDSLADDQQACGHWVPVHGRAGLLPAQAGALRRCLGNLIGNAIRYGGQTEVFLWDTGDEVGIEVRDHGPGLPEAELERVMAPFYRVEGSRNRHHGGVGLGLSIARDIVARHQGRLQLRNAAGGGLLAIVVLPRQPAAA